MNAYYPVSTDKIFHKSAQGETYRLDSFDNPIRLYAALNVIPEFSVINVSSQNKAEAESLILSVHTAELLEAYKSGYQIEDYNQSGILYQKDFYSYVLESALCAKYVALDALNSGQAFTFVGGGHHAEKDKGLGFCPINTMAIAATVASNNGNRVATVDLDVHYGNGVFDILKDKENILCTNIWGQKVEKWKYFESQGNIWHRQVKNAEQYFEQLNYLLEQIDNFNAYLVIYHLGLDVLSSDRMGGIEGFDEDALYKREEILKQFFNEGSYKYAIFRGGAYVDYSKSVEEVQKQKENITKLQQEILYMYNR